MGTWRTASIRSIPTSDKLKASAMLVEKVEGPVTLNIVGHLTDASAMGTAGAAFVSESTGPRSFPDRADIFVVNDSAPPRPPGVPSSEYALSQSTTCGSTPEPVRRLRTRRGSRCPTRQRVGQVLDIPPGGSVMGVMAASMPPSACSVLRPVSSPV